MEALRPATRPRDGADQNGSLLFDPVKSLCSSPSKSGGPEWPAGVSRPSARGFTRPVGRIGFGRLRCTIGPKTCKSISAIFVWWMGQGWPPLLVLPRDTGPGPFLASANLPLCGALAACCATSLLFREKTGRPVMPALKYYLTFSPPPPPSPSTAAHPLSPSVVPP